MLEKKRHIHIFLIGLCICLINKIKADLCGVICIFTNSLNILSFREEDFVKFNENF
jgi:hypothetical protein